MDYLNLIKNIFLKVKTNFDKIKLNKDFSKKIEKGYGGDITMFFDKYIEDIIIENIQNYVSKILTEERGIISFNNGKVFAVIDPVDGSINTSRNLPFCASSIALFKGNKFKDIFASGILDLVTGEIFLCDGKNVYLNDKTVYISDTQDLKNALVSIEFRTTNEIDDKSLKIIGNLVKSIRYIRFFGAIALEIAYVASGRLDAFIVPFPRVRFLDVCAGLFMVKTAGGFVEIINDNLEEIDIFENKRYGLIATNRNLYYKIKEIL